VRVHYLLPTALREDFLLLFPAEQVRVQRFSQMVAGAKDHFTVTHEDRLYVAGVLGENKLVVTFGKSAWQWSPAEIVAFEAVLERAGFGPVEYRHQRREVV
jgi:hypothetical protein